MADDQPGPGQLIRRAVFAAAALKGIKGSEPALEKATGVSRGALRRLFAGGEPEGDVRHPCKAHPFRDVELPQELGLDESDAGRIGLGHSRLLCADH